VERPIDVLRSEVERALVRGDGGSAACTLFSDGIEALLRDAFAGGEGVSVLALGGLARRELAPHADVDLLVLVAERDERLCAEVERLLYALWDAGLVLGHAVRTPAEVEAAALDDQHAATALLEARPVAGDTDLAAVAQRRFGSQVLPRLRARLIGDKLAEMKERRARFGGSVHMVEPNVKASPGGLRDLHSALWIGLAHSGPVPTGKDGLSRLLELGVVFEREAAALRSAREQLLSLRAALHVVSGRAEDRLLFGHQAPIATLLDVLPRERETASEALMRRYFFAALLMRRTVDDVVERATLPPPAAPSRGREVARGFRAAAGYLFLADAELFVREPARMVDAVRVADEEGLRLAPRLRYRVYEALQHHGKLFDDEAVGRALLALCHSRGAKVAPFTALLEAGVLGAISQDLSRLEGRFKQDGYHAYTTDAHICRVTDMALRAASGNEPVPEALAPSVARTSRFHLVVLGALFHDIGKGLPGDHSKVGAEICLREARRMGLPPGEREILRFLVEEHLLLSWASQRRDLTDPAVTEDVARRVKTPERLDLLALLTWVDIAGVAPGMFTDWKGRLLGLAVERVRAYLLSPHESGAVRGEHEAEIRRRAAESLSGIASPEALERFLEGASVRALASRLEEELMEDLAAFAAYDPEAKAPIITCSPAEGGHAHTLRVVCPDRRGLLAELARALLSHGANVLHAHADSRDDGIGFDAFRIDDGRGRALNSEVLTHALAALFEAGDGRPLAPLARRRPARRTGPRIEPRVQVIEGGDTWGAHIVELRGEDRPGLVADLARTFSTLGWNIVLAKINTEGVVARDTFYILPDDSDVEAAGPVLEAALVECLSPESREPGAP
jgi:[protein-PII] uridylyltransferase